MPKLWLTYAELADELSCAPAEVKSVVTTRGWDLERSRDGVDRVCVPPDVMRSYIVRAATRYSVLDMQADTMSDALRTTLLKLASRRKEEARFNLAS